MDDSCPPVLDSEGLFELLGGDAEAVQEVVEAFFHDRSRQLAEIQAAITAEDWTGLVKAAHSITGALGALSASRAAVSAQVLETTARQADLAQVLQSWAALRAEIEELEPALLVLVRKVS